MLKCVEMELDERHKLDALRKECKVSYRKQTL